MMLGNLPAESNAFIGRERDMVDLTRILDHARAVTLCGPGGIGKTRLALQLANSLAASYPDGLWIADLAEMSPRMGTAGGSGTAERLVPLVAGAVGVHGEPDRPLAETLIEALRPQTMLLILDTCEHLVADCAQFVAWLLGNCPSVRIIATSREPLRTRGEVIWRVPPLVLPAPASQPDSAATASDDIEGCEAARLFAARAMAVRPDFALTAANAEVVADICRTLDGVPLAIELAAARLQTLSAEQIQVRLASKFELLAHGDRTAPLRQQTLRATVDWSYDLLTRQERLLLGRLSVFSGWSLEMAEQACADEAIPSPDVLDLLTALIDKSLVTVDHDVAGSARYRLLDTVRQFATERMADRAELARMRRAHCDCMLTMVERAVRISLLSDEPSWPERVEAYRRAMADWTNFQLALEYCAEHGDVESGLRLCNAMRVVWVLMGDQSGSDWLDRFLSQASDVTPAVRSSSLVVRAEIAFEQQDYQALETYAAAALEASRSSPGGNLAGAHRMCALAALFAGQLPEAHEHIAASIGSARQAADRWEEGIALAIKATVTLGQGDTAAARVIYTEALAVLGESRGWMVARVHFGLGRVAIACGDSAEALLQFGDALRLYRQVGARLQMVRCLAAIGHLALEAGDLATARVDLTECVRLSLLTGQRKDIADALAALARLAVASGDAATGVRFSGTAKALFEAIGTPNAAEAAGLEALIAAAQSDLGSERVATLLADGRGMSAHQAAASMISSPAAEEARSAGPPPWPGPLTDREREVALLVADGLPNRVIGDKLFIAPATVARHIANIFGKLGFTSRAQLIAWVVTSSPAS